MRATPRILTTPSPPTRAVLAAQARAFYEDDKLTLQKIAPKLGVSVSTARKLVAEAGGTLRKQGRPPANRLPDCKHRSLVVYLWRIGCSYRYIAWKVDLSHQAIHGLVTQSLAQASTGDHPPEEADLAAEWLRADALRRQAPKVILPKQPEKARPIPIPA